MSRLLAILLLLCALLFPAVACAAWSILSGTVPTAAESIGRQLDKQILMRYSESADSLMGSRKNDAATRAGLVILGTSIVDLNDLTKSSPLGRQMTEEITRWLMKAGYRFMEMRRGTDLRFVKGRGEFILTRDVALLSQRTASGQVVLAGTYVVSGENVRFSVRLIHPDTNEVIAMGNATVPITREIVPMLEDREANRRAAPSVYTKLQ
jgi:TolB-like protein